MEPHSMVEYNKIIERLKYSSLLNENTQRKQFDLVANELKKNYENDLLYKISNQFMYIRLNKEEIKRIELKYLDKENQRYKTQLEICNKNIQISIKEIKEHRTVMKRMNQMFKVYRLDKGFTTNKLLQLELDNPSEGIFEINDKDDYLRKFTLDEKSLVTKSKYGDGEDMLNLSLDKFINYYYDKLTIKPEKIIIIDNTCSYLHLNNKPVSNKEIQQYERRFDPRPGRSFDISPIKRNTRSLNRTIKRTSNMSTSSLKKYTKAHSNINLLNYILNNYYRK